MALTIEDGTGVTGADTFIDEAGFSALQIAYWGAAEAGETALQEAALRRAFLFMQSLAWTKESDYPTFDGGIPDAVKAAQSFFALEELKNPGALQPSVVPGQQKILTRVGEIGWTPTGQTGTDAQRTVVTMAMDLLDDYLSGTGQTKFLARG